MQFPRSCRDKTGVVGRWERMITVWHGVKGEVVTDVERCKRECSPPGNLFLLRNQG